MTTQSKRINVTTTAYEGDAPFPEAEHYPEYVASALREAYPGFEVNVSVGLRSAVHVYDDTDPSLRETLGADLDVEHTIGCLVKVDLWDAFCADGYKAYTNG